MISKREVWIRLIHVVARKNYNIFQGKKGGFVNALAWAKSAPEYKKLIRREASEYGLVVKEIKEVEPLNKRIKEFAVAKKIVRLAGMVQKQHSVRFGTFYTYCSD